jgi:hypothetical protein
MAYNPKDYYYKQAKKENFAARSVFKLDSRDTSAFNNDARDGAVRSYDRPMACGRSRHQLGQPPHPPADEPDRG